MVTFIFAALFFFGPFIVFSPSLDADSRFLLILIDAVIIIPFWIYMFAQSKAKNKKIIMKRNKRQKEYENKYGIIEWDEK